MSVNTLRLIFSIAEILLMVVIIVNYGWVAFALAALLAVVTGIQMMIRII